MGYEIYANCTVVSALALSFEIQGVVFKHNEKVEWGLIIKATEIFRAHHLNRGFPESVLEQYTNSARSMYLTNGDSYQASVVNQCKSWFHNSYKY